MYKIYNIECNNMVDPVGIDTPVIMFSWKLKSDKHNTYQTFWQIKVWTENMLVWDSGRVGSDLVYGIPYEGAPLSTGTKYIWQVISEDNHGNIDKSSKGYFVTGILTGDFWKASWIEADRNRKSSNDSTDSAAMFSGELKSNEHPEEFLNPPVYIRRELNINKKLRKAMIYVTARGIYHLRIDGQVISNIFAPEYTSYDKHLEYQTYDVTDYLIKGKHALACILADGWYSGKIGLMGVGDQYGTEPSLLLQMVLEYEDDTSEIITSDESFCWNYGPYQYGDIFVGEYLDTKLELSGFDRPSYDDSEWKKVRIKDYGYVNLSGQSVMPVSEIMTIKPSLIKTPKGEWVLDAGENIVGYTCFSMNGKTGVELGLEHSEVLDREGNFLQNIMGQNKNQKDRILFHSDEHFAYKPLFTFHGFRYVKVTGISEVDPADFIIVVIGSKLQKTGNFTTSDAMINQLQENIVRSQGGNFLAIPTDCPQRERAGWTGDMQVYTPTATFNMNVNAFLKRWLYDMRLEQLDDGQIPNVIPDIPSNEYVQDNSSGHISSAGWGDACIIVPYRLYNAYGDKSTLRDNYDMMERWMKYIEKQSGEQMNWGAKFHFGDWLIPSILAETGEPFETAFKTKEPVALAMYAYVSKMMAEISSILGKNKKADQYIKLYSRISKHFDQKYIGEDGSMDYPLQGLYVLALAMNLVSPEKKEKCKRHLVDLIHKNKDCLDTGFLSMPFLLDVLCDNGENELAYRILNQKKPPSWLYEIENGATTIWENWLAIKPDGTRTNSSYNHFAFGCVGDFLYRKIGGLVSAAPGYKQIRIEPDFSCGLSYSKLTYESPYGEVKVHWNKEGENYNLEVTLPPNTSGRIVIHGTTKEIGNGYHQFEINNCKIIDIRD